MAEHSTIEWTDATWNPVTGCSVVSPGCTNCYAMGLAGTRLKHHPSRAGLTTDSKAGPVWNGKVRLNEAWLTQPLQWKRPRRIFVCAHGDLFAEGVPDAWIDRVFAVMAACPQHTFQVLTKRSARMRAYSSHPETPARVALLRARIEKREASPPPIFISVNVHSERSRWPLRHIWLGVSTEDQRRADERVPDLLATPAAVRFVSAEPLLGAIDFDEWVERIDHCGSCCAENAPQDDDRCLSCGAKNTLISTWGAEQAERYRTGERYDDDSSAGRADIAGTSPIIDWIIVGGESGPGARPMHPDWARSIRDQCDAADVPFFFKQWGEYAPGAAFPNHIPASRSHDFGDPTLDDDHRAWRVGKKTAGRLLDGAEHNGMPAVMAANLPLTLEGPTS